MNVQEHFVHIDKGTFAACCDQCYFSDRLVDCVYAANELLQDSNGIEPKPPFLVDLGSVVLFRIGVQPLYSHISS